VKADAAVAPSKKKPAETAAPTMNERVWREIVSWFWVILAFLFIEGTLVQARVIPSGSMENTVLIGDHLIVSRMGYDAGIPFTAWHVPLWREPKRQQIIVFRAPLADQGYPDFIKRAIGLPGDRIKIVNGTVYINGKRLMEPYTLHSPGYSGLALENFPERGFELPFQDRPEWARELAENTKNGELVVPPGHYFMMGDNRDNSLDSRYWGFVPRENIIGTPVIIYMSINAPEGVWDPGHWGDRFGTYFDAVIHPGEVRWRRLFRTF
jgi:signal peptidase I